VKILIIEDEIELANDIEQFLSAQRYMCERASTYNEALQKISNYSYDCILLDLMLPGGNGMDILNLLKCENRNDGIIIISAKNSLDDKINGLKIGADDFLSKPFHQAELNARIFSVIRRKQFDNSNNIQSGSVHVNLLSKSVKVNSVSIVLTKKEFDLLIYFIGNKNKVISKSALAEYLSGDFADMFDNFDFVYAHVKNLKKKLNVPGNENQLKTVYGTGYKWEE
jgi:DNA-binding response OmpR family regulator